jgi:uncharacterized damage-inducible protein DinB
VASTTESEPWLRGTLAGVPVHLLPVFHSFAQVREDLAKHTAGVSEEQLWRPVTGQHSLGYHLKHIAGSVDRLTSYLLGNQLSDEQLEFLHHEHTSDSSAADLLRLVDESLQAAEGKFRLVTPECMTEARVVGRQLRPTTVFGLLVHVCEHTQRHVGQAIVIAKLLRGS